MKRAVNRHQLNVQSVPSCVVAEVSVKNHLYNFCVCIPVIIGYNFTCKYVSTSRIWQLMIHFVDQRC